jgi:hypothetical protein
LYSVDTFTCLDENPASLSDEDLKKSKEHYWVNRSLCRSSYLQLTRMFLFCFLLSSARLSW